MPTTVPSSGHDEHQIAIPPADGNAAAGSIAAGESQHTESAAGSTAASESQHTESAAGSSVSGESQRMQSGGNDKVIWKQLKSLHNMVFYIESLQYLGNAIGTVAFLWATVVLLGGFCSLLTRLDFWFATIMVFLEGTRVFISNDASVNQWLFGSTGAFRWDHFCFPKKDDYWNPLIAMSIGVGISLAPEFGSQIITGILKVAILVITCLLLIRRPNFFEGIIRRRDWGWLAVLALFMLASVCGTLYAFVHRVITHPGFNRANLKFAGLFYGWCVGTLVVAVMTMLIMFWMVNNRVPVPALQSIAALALVFLPLLHAKLGSKHGYFSISMATALLSVSIIEHGMADESGVRGGQINALLLGTSDLLSKIVNTIMPILFFWGVLFPLPGIPLKESFYMLFSLIAAVLIGNMQIPVAFLQILLSSLRLHSLLGGHHSHRDYNPLPDGASPNLVPSIVVFFVLELCQGSSNVLGIILGLISFTYRRWLLRDLKLKEEEQEWGAKAVNLYYHQAFMTIKEKGLYPMEKSTPPSICSFAIESLGCTSSEMQIVRLQVLDYYLGQQAESKSKTKLIAQIEKDATGFVTKIADTISHLITDEEINSDNHYKLLQIRSSLSVSVKFVCQLAAADGKFGTRIRQELSGNPILLHSLQRILHMENCPEDLRKKAMDAIKWLALNDKTTAKETGSTHAVIPKLMDVFLSTDYSHSLRKAAGEELANLTITSSDNCRTILAGPVAGRRNLIKNLIAVGQNDKYKNVAANLLRNLYANSGDMLIDIDPHSLESDLLTEQQEALRRKAAPSRDEPPAKTSGDTDCGQI